MNTKKLLEIMHVSERLKDATRHCYTSGGRHESVAEHSWRISLLAFFIKDEFPEADIDKVIRMCLIHDIGECFTGDIPTFLKTKEDEEREAFLLNEWVDSLPAPFRDEMKDMYREMDEQRTLESKLYKALDKIEAVISHNESDISTWSDNEYLLNLTYGYDKVEFSDFLVKFRNEIKKETEEIIMKKAPEKMPG